MQFHQNLMTGDSSESERKRPMPTLVGKVNVELLSEIVFLKWLMPVTHEETVSSNKIETESYVSSYFVLFFAMSFHLKVFWS